MTDIDIDLANRETALNGLTYVYAVRTDDRRRHPTGVYFQNVPVDPIDGMAVWDHKQVAQKGYFKIDLLHNSIYSAVRDEAHLVDLLITEPPWEAFQDRAIVAQLAQISNHYDVLQIIRPRSIVDLAICLALVRPGKKHLLRRPRSEIDREVWCRTNQFHFKKSHAISYAASLVVQLNLLLADAG